MAMSKQDFITLADTLRQMPCKSHALGGNSTVEWDDLVNSLADFCKKRNPAFNRRRWLDYIAGEYGPSGGKRL